MLARLHLITDDDVVATADFAPAARAVMETHGPRVAIHLRGHGVSGAALYGLARELTPVAETSGAGFVVNDRIDVALSAGAPAVELGRRSLPIRIARRLVGEDVRIGYSAHSAAEAAQAEVDGADFVLIGAVFETASHAGWQPGGPDLVRRATERLETPVFGIGGITPERIGDVLDAGAYGVAVLSGVWHTEDPVAAAGRYLTALS